MGILARDYYEVKLLNEFETFLSNKSLTRPKLFFNDGYEISSIIPCTILCKWNVRAQTSAAYYCVMFRNTSRMFCNGANVVRGTTYKCTNSPTLRGSMAMYAHDLPHFRLYLQCFNVENFTSLCKEWLQCVYLHVWSVRLCVCECVTWTRHFLYTFVAARRVLKNNATVGETTTINTIRRRMLCRAKRKFSFQHACCTWRSKSRYR